MDNVGVTLPRVTAVPSQEEIPRESQGRALIFPEMLWVTSQHHPGCGVTHTVFVTPD